MFADPGDGILVPVMTAVFDLSERSLDVVPAPFVVEAAPDQCGDEGATPAGAHSSVEFGDELVVQRNVQANVLKLAHKGCYAHREVSWAVTLSGPGADSARSAALASTVTSSISPVV
ncbi:MAG TPA: hypothetical protein VMY88_00585, partial [Acidimicrobiales bacterium]|nr:hypothetical protein [Acidimicrobiales bacterium]